MMKKNCLPVFAAIALLLVFSGCSEEPDDSYYVYLTDIPADVYNDRNGYFLALFHDKSDIVANGESASNRTPFKNAVATNSWTLPHQSSLTVAFSTPLATGDYVLVFGTSTFIPNTYEDNGLGATYATASTQPTLTWTIPTYSPPLNPDGYDDSNITTYTLSLQTVHLTFTERRANSIPFDKHFIYTGSRKFLEHNNSN